MKIWLDDEREPPDITWLWVKIPRYVNYLLNLADVSEISLDHDLGDDDGIGTGYDVLKFIERKLHEDGAEPPVIHIHTTNPSARRKMELAVESINRYKKE